MLINCTCHEAVWCNNLVSKDYSTSAGWAELSKGFKLSYLFSDSSDSQKCTVQPLYIENT